MPGFMVRVGFQVIPSVFAFGHAPIPQRLAMHASFSRNVIAVELGFAMIVRESMRRVPEHLRLIDRVAILNAGHEAEVVFGHFLPDWGQQR
jgi:hypothetical protein